MAYSSHITRHSPTAFVVLIDRSGSMAEKIAFAGRQMPKSRAVALVANTFIDELLFRARREGGTRDYYDIAVVGYGGEGPQSLLSPTGEFTTPSHLAVSGVRRETFSRERILPSGRSVVAVTGHNVWIEEQAAGATPMCGALREAHALVERWCRRSKNARSYPPTVINITDGETSDGSEEDVRRIAEEIRRTGTSDGATLLIKHTSGTLGTTSGRARRERGRAGDISIVTRRAARPPLRTSALRHIERNARELPRRHRHDAPRGLGTIPRNGFQQPHRPDRRNDQYRIGQFNHVMILTIAQYIEAFTASEGRLRTLRRLRPIACPPRGTGVGEGRVWVEGEGEPVFTVPGHGLVEFEVMAGDVAMTLRCPLCFGPSPATRLRDVAERERALASPFFIPWRVLEREVVLFDASGRTVEVDILARQMPEGESLADFVRRATSRSEKGALAAAATSFEELCRWADGVGRRGIALRRLVVSPEGVVSLSAFSANDEREQVAAILGAALHGSESLFDDQAQGTGYDFGGGGAPVVKDGGAMLWARAGMGRAFEGAWLVADSFRKGRAEFETLQGKGLIDRTGRVVVEPLYEELAWDETWGLFAVMVEGRWSILDSEGRQLTMRHYDWLGEYSEGMVLAVRDGKCGFVDAEGREVVACMYDDASSFSEGCALVKKGDETFFIDSGGRRL